MLHLPQNLEHWHSPAKPTYKGGRWGDQIEKLLYRGKYRNLRAIFIHPLVLRKEDQAQLRLFRDRTDPQ